MMIIIVITTITMGKEKEREREKRREKNQECGITTITIFPINPNLRYVATL